MQRHTLISYALVRLKTDANPEAWLQQQFPGGGGAAAGVSPMPPAASAAVDAAPTTSEGAASHYAIARSPLPEDNEPTTSAAQPQPSEHSAARAPTASSPTASSGPATTIAIDAAEAPVEGAGAAATAKNTVVPFVHQNVVELDDAFDDGEILVPDSLGFALHRRTIGDQPKIDRLWREPKLVFFYTNNVLFFLTCLLVVTILPRVYSNWWTPLHYVGTVGGVVNLLGWVGSHSRQRLFHVMQTADYWITATNFFLPNIAMIFVLYSLTQAVAAIVFQIIFMFLGMVAFISLDSMSSTTLRLRSMSSAGGVFLMWTMWLSMRLVDYIASPEAQAAYNTAVDFAIVATTFGAITITGHLNNGIFFTKMTVKGIALGQEFAMLNSGVNMLPFSWPPTSEGDEMTTLAASGLLMQPNQLMLPVMHSESNSDVRVFSPPASPETSHSAQNQAQSALPATAKNDTAPNDTSNPLPVLAAGGDTEHHATTTSPVHHSSTKRRVMSVISAVHVDGDDAAVDAAKTSISASYRELDRFGDPILLHFERFQHTPEFTSHGEELILPTRPPRIFLRECVASSPVLPKLLTSTGFGPVAALLLAGSWAMMWAWLHAVNPTNPNNRTTITIVHHIGAIVFLLLNAIWIAGMSRARFRAVLGSPDVYVAAASLVVVHVGYSVVWYRLNLPASAIVLQVLVAVVTPLVLCGADASHLVSRQARGVFYAMACLACFLPWLMLRLSPFVLPAAVITALDGPVDIGVIVASPRTFVAAGWLNMSFFFLKFAFTSLVLKRDAAVLTVPYTGVVPTVDE